jgi:hypothetical protein
MNRQLGCAAYESSGRSSATRQQVYLVIDAWFGFQPRETQQLLQQALKLEIWNHISPELAVSRYASRLQDRRPPGEEYLPELAQLAQRAEPMRLGPVFTVSTNRWIWRRYPLIEAHIRSLQLPGGASGPTGIA